MTTNVPCPIWIDQLIDRELDDLLHRQAQLPNDHRAGEIHALETLLGILRMSSIQSEK